MRSRDLVDYFEKLYSTIETLPEFEKKTKGIALRIFSSIEVYRFVSVRTKVPWVFIGLVHEMECSGNFSRQILNGEPWNQKTTLVPKGFGPWNSWAESVLDPATFSSLSKDDWSIGRVAIELERWNGWGYAYKDKNSPYLWSGSNHGVGSGKFVKDGKYDENAVSEQVGAMVILKRLEKMGIKSRCLKLSNKDPKVVFDKNGEHISEIVVDFQKTLNEMILKYYKDQIDLLKIDGWAGKKTSDALFEITKLYLVGDPRK